MWATFRSGWNFLTALVVILMAERCSSAPGLCWSRCGMQPIFSAVLSMRVPCAGPMGWSCQQCACGRTYVGLKLPNRLKVPEGRRDEGRRGTHFRPLQRAPEKGHPLSLHAACTSPRPPTATTSTPLVKLHSKECFFHLSTSRLLLELGPQRFGERRGRIG